ncbi:histidine kinase [Caballeronia novacaledonica]|uniref:Histidine kinase n=1 Tax=Caballeronia novacaledonica TaxID=1544861 RepID=A0A2U3IDA6_9BURK|nr:response regulator [Caballeronia novacaledonica]SPB18201.1 histidine kinase [Caballeronia novacaledonica]
MTRVLFVDDHRETADSFSDIALALGHHPSVAYDGATALKLTSDEVFEVIFLDVTLPDADGRDVCCQIRSGASGTARLVAVTGYDDLRGTVGMEVFDDCLLKPITIDELQRQLAAP